ncbi:helix-turn-helix domain-containing protein [Fibrella aquatica]|uniref:helix-turn-helix domain-containing protein n=1 Tax=Fibrella aquatica TaxID=3242487 RepID=UPI003520980F
MIKPQSTIEMLGIAFRDLIRDTIRAELQSIPQAVSAPIPDRIGGIKLFAEVTGMAPQTGYNLVAKRMVPFAKRGAKLVFSEASLREWMLENKHPVKGSIASIADQFILKPTARRKGKRGL